LSGVTICSCST